MTELRVDCPAKINIFLEVLGKRTDGYHEVTTVMQTVELYDRLFFSVQESGIDIHCSDSSVPTDERNLVFKTAQLLLAETGKSCGVSVRLEKRIPVASGLGGASSDSAGTFIALNRLWNLGLTKEDLLNLSKKIGTDIAFFIQLAMDDFSGFSGGTLLGKGRGNEMMHLPPLPVSWLILIAPAFHLSTKWVYENPLLQLTGERRDFKIVVDALESQDLRLISKLLFNRLEEVVVPKYPDIDRIKSRLLQMGTAGALMTGSGPVVFGLVDDENKAGEIAERILNNGKEDRVYVTRTV